MSARNIFSASLDEALLGLEGRGVGFEALCAWFLRTDPEWSARVRKVWRWDDWPGRWGPDRGIDLVAELVGGELVAVQSKHYALSSTVTKADVDSFLSESARETFVDRLLIATTQRLAAGAQQVIDAQEKPVTVILRDRLEEAHVDWAGFASADAQPFERLTPKAHQRDAVDAVVAGLRAAPRGQLLMPCGTGKTLTSMWIAEELGAERIVVLVPRLVLLRQTVQVWRAQASEPFEALKVCSHTVGAGDEDDEVTAADLPLAHVGGPVTTDPDVIADFLRGPGRRVLFATYQSSPQVGRALRQMPGERLDLAICDEAHNCAGLEGGNFRTILSDQRIPVTRRLFVTATPTVFSSKAAQKAGSVGTAVASMDDQRKFGRVLHRLTFKEAVKRELLCPFQIVVMPVSDDDIAELVERRRLVTVDGGDHVTDAFNLAAQIACLRTMAVYGCRRLVAFHPRVKASEEFTRDVRRAADLLDPRNRPDGFTAVHVDGYMTAPKRDQAMRRFVTDDPAPQLLSNVRLLAEGLDVPGIDGVCLIDTNRSPSAVVQAVGRAVRPSPGKTVGTVLLPVLIRDGQSVEDALAGSDHKPLLDVLAALLSIDNEITTTIEDVRIELGPRTPGRDRQPDWQLSAPTEVGEEFAAAIEISVLELLGSDGPKADEVAPPPSPRPRPAPYPQPGEFGEAVYTGPVVAYEDLDWSDPETLEQGLLYAKLYREESPGEPVEACGEHLGYPVGRWWRRVMKLWESGRLPDTVKPELAAVFSWLCVPQDHTRTRAEMRELDPVSLERRLEDWLAPYFRGRGDNDLDELIRTRNVTKAMAPEVLDAIPTSIADEQRLSLALRLLKLGGDAAYSLPLEQQAVRRGFLESLREPGRGHGLDISPLPNGKPQSGANAAYAVGWDAAQRGLELVRQASQQQPRGRSSTPAASASRPPHRRRRPTSR